MKYDDQDKDKDFGKQDLLQQEDAGLHQQSVDTKAENPSFSVPEPLLGCGFDCEVKEKKVDPETQEHCEGFRKIRGAHDAPDLIESAAAIL